MPLQWCSLFCLNVENTPGNPLCKIMIDLDLSYVERKNLHPYYLSNFKKTKVASYCKRSCLHSHMKASTTRLHQLKLVSVMDSTEAKHGSQLNNTQRLIFINEVAAALVILSAGFTLHRVTGSIKLWNHNICDIFKLWNACLGSVWFWMTLVVVKWTAVTCRISCVLEIVGGHNANECALEQSWTPSVNCPLLSFSLYWKGHGTEKVCVYSGEIAENNVWAQSSHLNDMQG